LLLGTLISGAALLSGCYTYRQVSAAPTPGAHLAFDLNDQGRVGVAPQMGPEVARIEGVLARSSDSGYVVQVASVTGIGGGQTKWGGEPVTLRPEYVKAVSERQLSRRRTVVAASIATAAVVAFIATREIVGSGSSPGEGTGNGGGNGTLSRGRLRRP
jgi:hypothetical protein